MDTIDRAGGFYQFPLCLLAAPWPFETVLETAFHYGVCHYLSCALGADWKSEAPGAAFDNARAKIGFKGGALVKFIAGFERANSYVARWKEKSGRMPCFARLRTDLHFAALSGDELSEREWRLLVGIFSAIGNKPMVKLGWQQMQWRAAGWASEPEQAVGFVGPIYPRGQIERSLATLLGRGFVFAATYRKGERYWSHRLNHAEIWREIDALKLANPAAAARRRMDENRSAMLREKLTGVTVSGVSLRVG